MHISNDSGEISGDITGEITHLLHRWSQGDVSALDTLWPLVYDDVRRLARRQLASERGERTLQGTALVNEAFIKLLGQRSAQWQNRSQFLAVASQIMRRVLVDHARRRHAQRRGQNAQKLSLDDSQAAAEIENVQAAQAFDNDKIDILAIDAALLRLEQIDATQCQIVELRYFGGLTIEETAETVGVSPATVKREWTMARAWLRRELATMDQHAT